MWPRCGASRRGAIAVAGPVAAAAAALLHIVVIIVSVITGLAAAAAVAFVAFRVHRWRTGGTGRVFLPAPPPRAIQRPSQAPRQVTSGQPKAIEQHVHHYWHGVTAEDVTTIIAQAAEDD